MDKSAQLILWFDQLGIEDVPFTGGKNASRRQHIRFLRPGIRSRVIYFHGPHQLRVGFTRCSPNDVDLSIHHTRGMPPSRRWHVSPLRPCEIRPRTSPAKNGRGHNSCDY